MDLVIGIDGGGSKTQAQAAGLDGPALGHGTGGPSNYQGVGVATAQAALAEASASALAEAGLPSARAAAVCLGLAGAGRPEDHALFADWVAAQWPGARALVVNDAELVLAAGAPQGWGLAVIAGTGSIAYGRSPAGATARADGWGPLLGDDGSGYAIGRAALRAAAAAHDGRGTPTVLLGDILAHWHLPDAVALVARAYRPHLSTAEVAGLAVLVEKAADRGDAVALGILAEAGKQLAVTAAAVAGRLGMTGEAPCAVAGSVFIKGRRVLEAFERGLRDKGVTPAPLAPVEAPAWGGVLLARALVLPRDS